MRQRTSHILRFIIEPLSAQAGLRQKRTEVMIQEKRKSELTTLCYIEKDGCYLMLHRVKKEKDVNKDKWIGVGGHFEKDESPEECLLREVKEETGLTLTSWKFRGILTFIAEGWPMEYICLFTADGFSGELKACDEGTLEWVKKEDVFKLNLWEGDKIFHRLLLEREDFFSLKLKYDGDELKEWVLNGGQEDGAGKSGTL